jgi:hypothetical protein
MHFCAVEEVIALTAEVRDAYSPDFVPVPLTVRQPEGGVMREVARTSSSAGNAKTVDIEDNAKSEVNTELKENILKMGNGTKLVPGLFDWVCLFFSLFVTTLQGADCHLWTNLCSESTVLQHAISRKLFLTWNN